MDLIRKGDHAQVPVLMGMNKDEVRARRAGRGPLLLGSGAHASCVRVCAVFLRCVACVARRLCNAHSRDVRWHRLTGQHLHFRPARHHPRYMAARQRQRCHAGFLLRLSFPPSHTVPSLHGANSCFPAGVDFPLTPAKALVALQHFFNASTADAVVQQYPESRFA